MENSFFSDDEGEKAGLDEREAPRTDIVITARGPT